MSEAYRERFDFLFPASGPVRYRLHAPDLNDTRWSVFDHELKKSIGFGITPEDAVDVALEARRMRQFTLPFTDELQLQHG
jgi:hypothetical protein